MAGKMPGVNDHTVFLHLDEFLLPQLTAPLSQLQVATGKTGRYDLLPFE